jgi:glycine/D-amino acid oxidase-like deaminating enzyme
VWQDHDLKPTYDVVVIGAGVHGLATAYYLASNHGIRNIAVLDRSYLGGGGSGRNTSRGKRAAGEPGSAKSAGIAGKDPSKMPRAELADLIQSMTDQMMNAARDLQFELAARLRDEIQDLKRELRGMDAAGIS